MNRWDNYTDTLGELCHSELFHAGKKYENSRYRMRSTYDDRKNNRKIVGFVQDGSAGVIEKGYKVANTNRMNKAADKTTGGKARDAEYNTRTTEERQKRGTTTFTGETKVGSSIRIQQEKARKLITHFMDMYYDTLWKKKFARFSDAEKPSFIAMEIQRLINDNDLLEVTPWGEDSINTNFKSWVREEMASRDKQSNYTNIPERTPRKRDY